MREQRSRRPEEGAAHDILAAEAFAMPAPDPSRRSRLTLPGDPAGDLAPHDILAAEEFAMPAPEGGPGQAGRGASAPARRRWAGVAGAGLLALWLRRRRQ